MADKPWRSASLDELRASDPGSIAIGPFGSRMKSEVYVPAGVPVIRGSNLGATKAFVGDFVYVSPEFAAGLERCNVYDGDLVFPHRGNIGEVGIVTGGEDAHYVLSTSMMKISLDRSRVEPLFLFYFFKSTFGRYELLKNASQVGTPGIATPLTSLRSIHVPVPPIEEQQSISCILSVLDDKIELNRCMNQTLEEMAQAIFRSWFVDFGPVWYNLQRKGPETQRRSGEQLQPSAPLRLGISALNPEIADLFPDAFEESELGEIPLGWKATTISNIADINLHSLSKADPFSVIDYVEISDVVRGDVSKVVRYERGTEPSRARRRLQHGDTVLSTVRPDRGAHFLCLNPPETLVASTGFAVLSPKDSSWAFLYTALTRPEIGEILGRLADGGAYPAIRSDVIGNLAVVIPQNPQLLQEFERIAEPLFDKSARNRDQSRTLAALRDTLLPKLISGELRVPDAEKAVEAVL